jgi:hypothetical protein
MRPLIEKKFKISHLLCGNVLNVNAIHKKATLKGSGETLI